MDEKIKTLVDENQLTFIGEHETYEKYLLEKEPALFVERVELWGEKLRNAYCSACGRYINYELKGTTLIPNTTACFTDKEVTVDIEAPTGELWFADWFDESTPIFEEVDRKSFDINNAKVRADRMLLYGAMNVGHFFVGGTYPRVCEQDGIFYIGAVESVEDYFEDEVFLAAPGGHIHGRIGTELRWTTVVDAQVLTALFIQQFGEKEGLQKLQEAKCSADVVVQVPPGVYRITHYPNRTDDIELYAKIEQVKGE